jgi:diguanylate cyclase (GGDEF)-like protein
LKIGGMLQQKRGLFAIAAFAVGLFVVLVMPLKFSLQQRNAEDILFNRIEPMLQSTQQIQTSMLNMDTSARGYQSSGDAGFLGAYAAGLQDFTTAVHLAENQARTLGDPYPQNLQNSVQAAKAWQSAAAPTLFFQQSAGSAPAIVDSRSDLFEAFRVSSGAMRADLLQREALAQQQMQASERARDIAYVAAGGVLVVLVGVFAFMVWQRQRSLESEARTARSLQETSEQLRQQAYHDALTGLPNRALFLEHLSNALDAGGGPNGRISVLFLDIDGFKVINDSLGHVAGDRLLTAIGERLREGVRPQDTVARFGGDEFAILLTDVAGEQDVSQIAERVMATVRQPYLLDGHEVVVTASIGIARAGTDQRSETSEELLRNADIALYEAKAAGKACAALFHPRMSERAVERLHLEADLRRAVERGELRLVYQPIIELQTGTLRGLEALMRWDHPDRGPVPPSVFIPAAEESGLIHSIGDWAFAEVCNQARAWRLRVAERDDFVMCVNISVRELAQPDLCARIALVLRDTGVPATTIELEITESTLMQDSGRAFASIRGLRDMGLRLALDDFGTGYSSLSYLRRFTVDTIKLDQSFVAAVDSDEGAMAIVQAVTALAHARGMVVTAEGIETAEHLRQVIALQCDYGQGFYFDQPLTPKQIAERDFWSHAWDINGNSASSHVRA